MIARLRYLWLTLCTHGQRRRGRAALARAAAIHQAHTCQRPDSVHLSPTERAMWALLAVTTWTDEELEHLQALVTAYEGRPQ
jgi:hypothetical protein